MVAVRQLAESQGFVQMLAVADIYQFVNSFTINDESNRSTLAGLRASVLEWVSFFVQENPLFAQATNYQAFLENALLLLVSRIFVLVGR
ncbi:hypothetical protein COT42_01360 [Candidatus Saganbacteria bacterium CG08_land_8_20_14_0_20_45_16]|uniref:Uncharacterized protein n=1 Tax=Candidatus Saganbacteria bacterium CG08_land_8_20_14_0_20_45_16 TaxID=2014293 RepID=A0A2H0Y3F0_UNCSA|nr:MAG: hypothetical protein COT42_01360 [Candidatus Saganbacteria bacterium CG08_land_8_20_14_0_20_45_16]